MFKLFLGTLLMATWSGKFAALQVMPNITTIVMVTHFLHDANYADRIINMFDGEIVSQVEM